jgi:hypothetical protein
MRIYTFAIAWIEGLVGILDIAHRELIFEFIMTDDCRSEGKAQQCEEMVGMHPVRGGFVIIT